jgi:hypothetical protein
LLVPYHDLAERAIVPAETLSGARRCSSPRDQQRASSEEATIQPTRHPQVELKRTSN